MSDSPNEGRQPLWLDEDVAVWLHELAERDYYQGDVQKAMNDCLRTVREAMTHPQDPWAGISFQARAKAARREGS